ncbi:MAG TPA: hypothetical protein VF669_09270 [Tepidisphaeraceae bacterium]
MYWTPAVVPVNTLQEEFDVSIDGKSDSSIVSLDSPSYRSFAIRSLRIDGGDGLRMTSTTLALTNALTVNGFFEVAGATVSLPAGATISGTGRISTTGTNGRILSAGGALTIGSGITISAIGDYQSPHTYVGSASYPLISNGAITAADPFTVVTAAGSTFTNNGSINIANQATVEINTTIQQLSDLGTINNAGSGLLRLLGTLNNSGRTFNLDNAGSLEVGGTIVGGTLTSSGSTQVVFAAAGTRLDNVIVNAPALAKGTVKVVAGQTFSGSTSLNLLGSLVSESGALTIGADATVRGKGTIGTTTQSVINYGNISADTNGATLTVSTSSLTNLGTIESKSGATVALAGTYTTSGLGTIIGSGGTLLLAGTLDNTGQTYTMPALPTRLRNAKMVGGTLSTTPGADLVVDPNTNATLDDLVLNGTLQMPSSGNLYLPHGISGNATILLGSITAKKISSSPSPSTDPLVIGSGVTIKGGTAQIGSSIQPLINHGTIQADGAATVALSGSSIFTDGTLRILRNGLMQSPSLQLGDNARLSLDLYYFTKLEVTGNLDLSHEDYLDLTNITGPGPYVVASYTGSLTGVFDHVTDRCTVDYSVPHYITVRAVPEPIFPTLALASLFLLSRRRSRL